MTQIDVAQAIIDRSTFDPRCASAVNRWLEQPPPAHFGSRIAARVNAEMLIEALRLVRDEKRKAVS